MPQLPIFAVHKRPAERKEGTVWAQKPDAGFGATLEAICGSVSDIREGSRAGDKLWILLSPL